MYLLGNDMLLNVSLYLIIIILQLNLQLIFFNILILKKKEAPWGLRKKNRLVQGNK